MFALLSFAIQKFKVKFCYLEILNSCSFSFQQTFKLQVGRHLVEDNNLSIDIFPAGMEEILEKVRNAGHSYVTAHHYELSLRVNLAILSWILDNNSHCLQCLLWILAHIPHSHYSLMENSLKRNFENDLSCLDLY